MSTNRAASERDAARASDDIMLIRDILQRYCEIWRADAVRRSARDDPESAAFTEKLAHIHTFVRRLCEKLTEGRIGLCNAANNLFFKENGTKLRADVVALPLFIRVPQSCSERAGVSLDASSVARDRAEVVAALANIIAWSRTSSRASRKRESGAVIAAKQIFGVATHEIFLECSEKIRNRAKGP